MPWKKYLLEVITTSFESYKKGEWITIVRNKLKDKMEAEDITKKLSGLSVKW